MTNSNPYNDLPIQEIANVTYEFIESGDSVYLKWTCPGCGERAMSDDELTLVPTPNGKPGQKSVALHHKYLHTEKANGDPCMVSVDVNAGLFGFMLLIKR